MPSCRGVDDRLPGVTLIAIDLDGTLLRSDGGVSEQTVETLQRCTAAGMTLVVATGRPLRWVRPVAQRLGHTGVALCANGALVWDAPTEEVVASNPLDPAVTRQVVDVVRDRIPGAAFAVETVTGFGQEAHYLTHPADLETEPAIGSIADLIRDEVIKLLVQHRSVGAEQLMAATNDAMAALAEVTYSGGHGLVEISAKGVTKASTLATLAARLGVSAEDAIAFGDMPNDLPMLAWAGTSYAMANAHPDVLAAADHVAPSNDDDGVATVLTTLLSS